MKKILVFLLGILVMTSMIAGCGDSKKADSKPAAQKFISIATGGTSGTYFPLGGALADILNKNVPGCSASAQSTGASVANINLLQQNKVDIAFIQNDIAYYAANGIEMFKDKKVDSFKGLATLYPEAVQIITLKKSGIKDVADFRGKRIAVGAASSGTEANARQIMAAYGIKYEDIRVQYLSFSEAVTALKDGNVDAAFVTAGHPTAAIQNLAAQNDVVLVPIADDKADALIKQYPFYTKLTIKANTYANQTTDVPAVAVKCMLAVTDKMDADTAYKVTKALYGNLERMKAAHSAANFISKDTAKEGMPVELNAGAEQFFSSK